MLVASGAKVLAIDHAELQIQYGKERIEALKRGDITSFIGAKFSFEHFESNSYFRNKFFDELDYAKLKNNIDNLELLVADFMNLEHSLHLNTIGSLPLGFEVDYSVFNKVYLSNVFDHYFGISNRKFRVGNVVIKFDDFFEKFESGTLFYLAQYYNGCNFDVCDSVTKDEEKSQLLSKKDDRWSIRVLRRA